MTVWNVWGRLTVVMTVFLLLLMPLFSSSVRAAAVQKAKPQTAAEQILVKIKDGSNVGKDENSVSRHVGKFGKVTKIERVKEKKQSDGGAYALEVSEAEAAKVLADLQHDSEVAFAQWNYQYEPDATPDDPQYASQYAHTKTGIATAWDTTTGSSSVVIAVIGTGVKWSHPDLSANIWSNTGETAGDAIDNDSNGYMDDVRGWDFYGGDNDPNDTDGHDTSVAGVAAAVGNNTTGVTGVCWTCKIMPLRVEYSSLEVAEAIDYAVANGAKIINMSFGNYDVTKYGPDTVVETAINSAIAADVMVIATAGNDNITTKRYPAAFDNVIAVGSTDSTDNRSTFSNWGDWVDIAAPGTSVLSTTISGTGYGSVSGTSFSAPYVAGVAGLMFSRTPAMSLEDARYSLEYTVDKLATDKALPSGRINATNAVLSDATPHLFAIIKSPWTGDELPTTGMIDISGTVLGDSYILEYQLFGGSTWTTISTGVQTINGSLGSLDASTVSTTELTLRLTATSGTATDTSTAVLEYAAKYRSGFPKSASIGSIFTPVTVANIDADSDLEMITASSSGKVTVLNSDGSVVTGWPKTLASTVIYGAPAVGDVDGDGSPDIVVTTYGTSTVIGQLYAYHADGTLITGWPKTVGAMRGGAVLKDIDGDSDLEIIVDSAVIGTGGYAKTSIYQGDGTLVTGWPYTYTTSNLQTAPAVGDLDNDGSLEIVSVVYCNLFVHTVAGVLKTSWALPSCTHSNPVLTDLDGNNDLEIVVGSSNKLAVYEGDGTLKWSYTLPTASSVYDMASVGDVDADGVPEVFYGASKASTGETVLYGFNASGTLLTGWPKTLLGTAGAEPTVADVNGDGVSDVVFPTHDGYVYGFEGNGDAIDHFPKDSKYVLYRAVTITDLDHDGIGEAVSATTDGYVHVWDLETAYAGVDTDWPMSRKDVTNSGLNFVFDSTVDSTAPTTSLTAPSSGASVSGSSVMVSADAVDAVGVTKVEFYRGGTTLIGTDTTSPYSVSWESTTLAAGSHTLTSKAYDAAGNVGTSSGVSVTVTDVTAPTSSITAPTVGATVSGSAVTVSATAADATGVTKVEFYRDGSTLINTDTTSPYSVSWNTTLISGGSHTLTAKAFDAAGNTVTSASVGVTVADITAPTVSVTAPTSGASVSGAAVTISATAADTTGVTKVEFYRDGTTLIGTDTSSPFSISWDSTTASVGSHTLTAKAFDAAGNATTSSSINVTVLDAVAPAVSIASPTAGTPVKRKAVVTIAATATDNVGVSKVEFYVGGVLKCTDTASAYTCAWTVPNTLATYVLQAKAYDAAGNITSSSTVSVPSY
jgi:subtilisin family serine protease